MNIDLILEKNLIYLNKVFSNANEIIKFVGDQFEKNGYCTSDYTNAMLKVFSDFPGIIVLDDGIAMPHARPENGTLKDGLMIIKLKNKVDFNNNDFEKIDTVIGLCSTGADRHIELIQLIGCLIENKIQNKIFIDNKDVLTFVKKINSNMEEN